MDGLEENSRQSAFAVYMESMPEGCNTILDSYISSNGRSFAAFDLQIKFNMKLFLCEFLSNDKEAEGPKRYIFLLKHILWDQAFTLKNIDPRKKEWG